MNAAEPGGCHYPFNTARSSDVCVVGPSAPKVTRQGRERTRGGSGRGGAGRSAAAGMRRPISCPAALWRQSLPGRRSLPRQKGAARSKEAEQLGTAAHRQPFPPGPSVPSPVANWLFGHRAAPTQRARRLLPTSLPDCGGEGMEGAGRARGRRGEGTGRCLGIVGHASAPLSGVGQWRPHAGRVTGCRED